MKPVNLALAIVVGALLCAPHSLYAQAPIKGELKDGKFSANHPIEMKKGNRYVIDMTSRDFDTFLLLKNPAGQEVSKDDDSGQGLNAQLTYDAKASGKYTIVATSYEKDKTGTYQITIKTSKSPPPPKLAVIELQSQKPTVTKGNIGAASPKFKGQPFDSYKVRFEKGKTYRIDVESDRIDCLLVIRKLGSQTPIAFNDDGGEGLNSRLNFTAPASGYFEVMAGSLGGRNGPYTVTIREVIPS